MSKNGKVEIVKAEAKQEENKNNTTRRKTSTKAEQLKKLQLKIDRLEKQAKAESLKNNPDYIRICGAIASAKATLSQKNAHYKELHEAMTDSEKRQERLSILKIKKHILELELSKSNMESPKRSRSKRAEDEKLSMTAVEKLSVSRKYDSVVY